MMQGKSSSLSVLLVTGGYRLASWSSLCCFALNSNAFGILSASAEGGGRACGVAYLAASKLVWANKYKDGKIHSRSMVGLSSRGLWRRFCAWLHRDDPENRSRGSQLNDGFRCMLLVDTPFLLLPSPAHCDSPPLFSEDPSPSDQRSRGVGVDSEQ
jgi:hypothetical protein